MSALDGRSPDRPRQLHDLRLPPTKDDPRPTFIWSAEVPRDAGDINRPGPPYPRLAWSPDGEEVRVDDADQLRQLRMRGYTEEPPAVVPVDPLTTLQAALAELSPEDRAQVLEQQRLQRLVALQDQLARLPDGALETLLRDAKTQATPARRPGRPPKADVA